MRTAGAAVALASALGLAAACGGGSLDQPPPPPSTGTPPGGTITGRERLGWTQEARDASELATFDYAIYVDGARSVLTGDTCTPAGASFECSAPLPSLTSGQHTLQLTSFTTSNGTMLESERSAALQVTVVAATAPADVAPPRNSSIATSDGHRFTASIVARGLDDPTDLAVAPDGRVFVAERAGRIRVLGADGLAEHAALELDGVATSDETGLTAIALHPDFDRNGHIYLAYTIDGREGLAFRIARFRERNGILAQGAVVARERASSGNAHAVARFGSDGRLYVGLAAGNDPRGAQSASSPLGKILRLNDDGTTPRDNPGVSAMFSSGHRDPRAFAWQPATGTMWALERDRDAGDELNAVVGGADYGWPIAKASSSSRSVPAVLVLPPGTDVSGASFVPPGQHSSLAGELLVASRGAEDLLRIRVGPAGRAGLVEGMLQGKYGRIAAVAVSLDGTIYIATANRDTWGPRRDVLIRISPAERN